MLRNSATTSSDNHAFNNDIVVITMKFIQLFNFLTVVEFNRGNLGLAFVGGF